MANSNAAQTLVVVFERDESLAGSLLGQLRASGYECRSARTPVEVFDLIARYPVGLVLVNLGQPATGRREFWVALDAQRRGRGVQVITYRYLLPGVDPEGSDGSGRATLADVEMRGAQGFSALVQAVRARLPLPSRALTDAEVSVNPQPPAAMTFTGQPAQNGALDAAQPREYRPTPTMPGVQADGLSIGEWMPQVRGMASMTGGQAMAESFEQQRTPMTSSPYSAPISPVTHHPAALNGQPGAAPGMSAAQGMFSAQMPAGDLAGMTDAVHALAAAGAPGYQQAAAAANAINPPSETLFLGQQAFEELRQTSHTLRGTANESYPAGERRSSGGVAPASLPAGVGGMGLSTTRAQGDGRQNQMLAPAPLATHIERPLSNVLVEGQLVSQERLEVALGIQRLLRGVDIDYRLGELLLLFRFLTQDQLLAALLVSRGLVSPAQVAAMGRIKQELHAIGMEYDLENLLILFRLLSSEQLREVRAEFA